MQELVSSFRHRQECNTVRCCMQACVAGRQWHATRLLCCARRAEIERAYVLLSLSERSGAGARGGWGGVPSPRRWRASAVCATVSVRSAIDGGQARLTLAGSTYVASAAKQYGCRLPPIRQTARVCLDADRQHDTG